MNETAHHALQCIVGLGNPGPTYADTRHNAGVWFIDALCHQYQTRLNLETRLRAYTGQIQINGHTVRLVVPNVFMNHSGQTVQLIAQYYKIKPEHLLIAHDELDLPNGAVRLKWGGGHGGHNGLRDTIQHLNNAHFYRLRLGIGRPIHASQDVATFVLNKPSTEQRLELDRAIAQTVPCVPDMVEGHWSKIMQQLHTNSKGNDNGL